MSPRRFLPPWSWCFMQNLGSRQKHAREQKAKRDIMGSVHSVVPTMPIRHSNVTERRDRTPLPAALVCRSFAQHTTRRCLFATVAPTRQMALRLLSIECHCHAALWAQAPHTNARNGWLGRGTGLGRTGLPNVEHKKARRKGDDVRSLLGRD